MEGREGGRLGGAGAEVAVRIQEHTKIVVRKKKETGHYYTGGQQKKSDKTDAICSQRTRTTLQTTTRPRSCMRQERIEEGGEIEPERENHREKRKSPEGIKRCQTSERPALTAPAAPPYVMSTRDRPTRG